MEPNFNPMEMWRRILAMVIYVMKRLTSLVTRLVPPLSLMFNPKSTSQAQLRGILNEPKDPSDSTSQASWEIMSTRCSGEMTSVQWCFWKKFLYQLEELKDRRAPELLEGYSSPIVPCSCLMILSDDTFLLFVDTFSMTKRRCVELCWLRCFILFQPRQRQPWWVAPACWCTSAGPQNPGIAAGVRKVRHTMWRRKVVWNTCEGPIPRSGTLWLALWKDVFGTCGRLWSTDGKVVCNHLYTTKAGTNAFKIQERCLECRKIIFEEKTALGAAKAAEKISAVRARQLQTPAIPTECC